MNGFAAVRGRLGSLWERLRVNFWFVPTLMCAAAGIMAFASLAIDSSVGDATLGGLPWFYSGGPQGARSLLTTIASSSITVAGTTFSITIAALSLASSQFGPRLLRNFVRDTGNQVVLGTYVATFLYCLFVMRDIRDFEGTRYVPEFSVTIAVMLAVANVAVLIYFIHHVAMSISADQVIARVVAELDQIVDRIYPDKPARAADDKVEDDTEEAPIPELSGGYIVTGRYAGYIQTIDVDSLARIAADADVLVQVRRRPGDFISAGEALALVVPEENGSDELSAAILSAFVTGSSRTAQQDVRFVLNQLVELAARALSPGINDPYTAVTCLDRMGSTFRRLATRPFPGVRRFDADGEQRVLAEIVTFDELVETAFDPIRVYGREHLSVVLRLLVVLGNIGLVASESRRAPLAHLAELAYEGSFPAMATAEDQARLELSFQQTMKRLDTEPLAGLPTSA